MTRAQLQAKTVENATPRDAPDDRRAQIAAALSSLIRKQGYAATSLTDIAVQAKLSPSHLRYYFATKEDILEHYFQGYCDRIVADVLRIERTTPEEWLEAFAAYVIGTPRVNRGTMGAMVEIFGVALHHPALAEAKTRYDNFMRRVFLDFFLWAGTARGIEPHDAAYTGWSLQIGMKLNALFQSDFSHEKANEIFLKEMRRMAGMRQPIAAGPVARGKTTKAKGAREKK
ncbi:MAG TPA: TetR/AcrR family transcriptional regulator [Rhizomicrobium sp.]|jgi:AcrR family transcriptional regulator